MSSVLVIDDLTVRVGHHGPPIIEGVSVSVDAGEILGIVGESGSGKTTLGLAALGYGRDGATIVDGDIRISGQSIVHGTAAQINRLRGSAIAYVPQDPANALNPARRLGSQLRETIALGGAETRSTTSARERIADTLREMGLPDDDRFLRRYPHELSGGQQQRVLLTLAFLREPDVVVLDEPTTGLDVTTQAQVLDTIRAACRHHGTAAIFVSHDLDVVGALAHRVLVLYGGRVAECGPTRQLFAAPRHQYSAALVAAAPRLTTDQTLVGIPGRAPRLHERSTGCAFAPRCPAADERCDDRPGPTPVAEDHVAFCHHPVSQRPRMLRRAEPAPRRPASIGSSLQAVGVRAAYGRVEVLHGIEVEVTRGACVALVGESGSGKTTLSQCVGGLHPPSGGGVFLDGRPLAPLARDRSIDDRRAIQYVFQNPYGSLNPRKTVRQILEQPAAALGTGSFDAHEWLAKVSLGPHVLDQRPQQLSGGERQRVAIARALVTRPEFLICDEITSALDVSIQASVIGLLDDLRCETGVGVLFVTHNLPVVAAIAETVVVMQHGQVVEHGPMHRVLAQPTTSYTRQLLDSVPSRDAVTHTHQGAAL